MISNRMRTALLLIVVLVAVAPPVAAQYMFLDTNGDGARTAADALVNGTNTVNVYLDTNHNRDGSLATCDADGVSPLTINSYVVNLSGTNVTYSGFINQMGSAFSTGFGEINAGDGKYKNGFGAPAPVAEGRYKLCTLTVSASANAVVTIVDLIPASSDFTSFGTGAGGCFGHDFDSTYKLTGPGGGSDWTDVDGLGPTQGPFPPVLAAIGNKTVNEGECLTFTATATTADGGPSVFTLDPGAPPGATITPGGQFNWCPTEAQGPGVYSITVRATENTSPPVSDQETIQVTVNEVNQAPVLAAIGNKTVQAGNLLSFAATAADADLPTNTLTFSLDPGAPLGASITTGGNFTWTPASSQAPGNYLITVRVTDNGVPALSDAKSFSVSVPDREFGPPVVTNPGDKTVNEGECLIFTVTATSAGGGTLTFTLGAGKPAGAAITAGGQFSWCPTEAQGPGVYPITVNCSDGVSVASATFNVTVREVNLAPVLAPIGNKVTCPGHPVTFTATATDADIPANVRTFSLDPGAPFGATISSSTGAFSWTPQTGGFFPVTIRVTDNGTPPLSDSEDVLIAVLLGSCGATPVLDPISDMTVDEGAVATQAIHGSDADGDPITFTKVAGPLWMMVTTTGPSAGLITLSPDFASAGSYPATVRASDGANASEAAFSIQVNNVCRTPTADAGGPYSGAINVPITFDGAGSSDPDGGALGYAWDFGDGLTGTGSNPSHTYAAAGTYTVSLRVTNPCGAFADDEATATVGTGCAVAQAFTVGGNKSINLGSGKPSSCVQIQPINGSFTIESVDLSSIVMQSAGTGSVGEIHALGTKTSLSNDKNGDGVDEIAACFRKEDLQQLFSLLNGTQQRTVTLRGDIGGGGKFCTTVDLTIKAGGGGNLAVSISPNPLNPSAVLTFATQDRGPVLVQLFDVRGRLVRTLRDDSDAAAGYHDVRIDGTDANGARLSSGVYFVRIRAGADEERKAITILK